MEQLLKTISDEPVDMTYLGIGSCPHLLAGANLDFKYDQIVPSCFHDTMLLTNKTMRIIHIDPFFDQCEGFLEAYWKQWGLVSLELEGGYHWVNDHLDIYILPQRIEHKEHYWFFESLIETILGTKGNLLIQEYTGYELQDINTKLYQGTSQKEKYKRRILLDMTFGTDSGCGTDMSKAQPFYHNGSFINLHFMEPPEMKRFLGISTKLDTLIQTKCLSKFYTTLNYYHEDYRRRLKGEKGLYDSSEYNDASTPEEIMMVLQNKIIIIFDVLIACGLVTKIDQETLQELFTNYKSYDPYKWYDRVYKLVNSHR